MSKIRFEQAPTFYVVDEIGQTTDKPLHVEVGESTAGGDVQNSLISDRTTSANGHLMLADATNGHVRFNSPQIDTTSRAASTTAPLVESISGNFGQTALVATLDALPGGPWMGNVLFRGAYKMSELARDTVPGIRLMENLQAAQALGYKAVVVHLSTCANDNGTSTSAEFQQTVRNYMQDVRSWNPGFRPLFLITPHSAHGVVSPTFGGSIGAWELIKAGEIEPVCATYGFSFDTAGTDIHWAEKWQVVRGLYTARVINRLASGDNNPALILQTAVRSGTKVTLTFNRSDLVIDDVNFHAVTQKGFRALDGGANLAISSVSCSGSKVILELASAPAGELYIQYGLDYSVAPYNTSTTQATRGGNLYAYDPAEPEFSVSLGLTVPVLDWAIPFRALVS